LPEGLYLYCIVDPEEKEGIGESGLLGTSTYLAAYKDIGAVVSKIPYAELEPSLDNITAHQRVVERFRRNGTTLPVKFGVIFKKEEGVKTLLAKSYPEYREKLTKFRDKDEFGIKVLVKKDGMQKLRTTLGKTSPEVARLQKSVAKASEGRRYFLQIKLNEAIKNETYRQIDALSAKIHRELKTHAEDNSILKTEHAQIVLNAAYLVSRKDGAAFLEQVSRVRRQYEAGGLVIHSSGPWAPYSFC
jgi:hypothetical protein